MLTGQLFGPPACKRAELHHLNEFPARFGFFVNLVWKIDPFHILPAKDLTSEEHKV